MVKFFRIDAIALFSNKVSIIVIKASIIIAAGTMTT